MIRRRKNFTLSFGECGAKRFAYPSKITGFEKHTGLDHNHRLPTRRAETGVKEEL